MQSHGLIFFQGEMQKDGTWPLFLSLSLSLFLPLSLSHPPPSRSLSLAARLPRPPFSPRIANTVSRARLVTALCSRRYSLAGCRDTLYRGA